MPYEDCGDPTCNGICTRPGARNEMESRVIPFADYVEVLRQRNRQAERAERAEDALAALERDNQALRVALKEACDNGWRAALALKQRKVYCGAHTHVSLVSDGDQGECATEFTFTDDDPDCPSEWVPCPKCGAECFVDRGVA